MEPSVWTSLFLVTAYLLVPCLPLPSHLVKVHAQEGGTVELSCKVKELENRTVSWLQVEGLHIISAGRYTFTTDPRFTADYREIGQVWVLRIRQVQTGDAGEYECQLSGDPPITQTVTLVVHAKRTEVTVVEEVEEEEVVAKVAKVLQRTGSSDTEGSRSEQEEEGSSLGGSSVVLAGGCLVVVLVCLLSLGAVRTCLGAEDRAGERPMPCTKSTQNRRQRSTSRRRRATTSREGDVVVSREGELVSNEENKVGRAQAEKESDYLEIPDWQTEGGDTGGGSAAKEGIQNVWDRRLSPD